MADNITYDDKEQGQLNDNPIIQQFRYLDANEIKAVVNANATELDATTTKTNSNETSITDIETKTDFISVTQSVDLDTMETDIATNTSKLANLQTGSINWLIASPEDTDYTIWLKAPIAGTITETTTKSDSGTCTATFKIEAVDLGGTTNSVSSTEESQAHASSNTFSAGDTIAITVSSNSSCENLSFTIKYTYSLA